MSGDGRDVVPSHADTGHLADKAAISEVMAAEQNSEACHQFMAMWDDGEMTMYRILQIHD